MQSFGFVKLNGDLNTLFNYQTFINAFITQFRLLTGAGWDRLLIALSVQPPHCNDTHTTLPDGFPVITSECGNPVMATIVLASFVILCKLILINMYIAVILENFTKAHDQEEVGITDDDVSMFFSVWERYDPQANEFISLEYLPDFCDELDRPFKLPKPNMVKLISLNIAICEGERIHCLDILKAVVSNKLGAVEDTEEFPIVMEDIENKFKEMYKIRMVAKVITSTLRRKKEELAAKSLQKAWRDYKLKQEIKLKLIAEKLRESGQIVQSHRERTFENLISQINQVKAPSNVIWGSKTSLHDSTMALSRSTLSMQNLPVNLTVSISNLYEASERRMQESLRPLPPNAIKPLYPSESPRKTSRESRISVENLNKAL